MKGEGEIGEGAEGHDHELLAKPIREIQNQIRPVAHLNGTIGFRIARATVRLHEPIEVPEAAQQPVPSVFAGLVSLETTLKAKKGKNYLASTTGCKGKKHPFSATLTFVPNGSDTTGGNVNTSASAKCSK